MKFPVLSSYNRYLLVEATLVQRMGAQAQAGLKLELDRDFSSNSTALRPVFAKRLAIDAGCQNGSQTCATITALYIPQLGAGVTQAQITFTLSNSSNLDILEGLQIGVKIGNPEFVRTITLAKYFLFFISLLTGYVYYKNWKLIPINLRIVEQKLILWQSSLLVLLNDPFYATIFYAPNSLHIIFTSISTVAYYSHLLYLWLVVFEVDSS